MPEAHSARAPAMSAAKLSSDMPQPEFTWILLESTPRMTDDDSIVKPGTDFLLDYEDPLLPSTVALHKRVLASDNADFGIVAVHPSGRFLICADHGGVEVQYILCDAGTRLATRLPSCADVGISRGYRRYSTRLSKRVDSEFADSRAHPRHGTGLVANHRRDGDYLVAHLFPAGSTHHTALLCYSTANAAWVLKRFASSPHHPPWESNGGVLAHDGRLWWVDTKHGVLTCDPSVDRPDLRYIALPEPDEDSDDYYQHRCLRISEGKLCCAEIRSQSGQQKIVVWTLSPDPEGSVWTMQYQQNLSEDEAFPRLPRGKVREIATIHPQRCHLLYLFFDLKLVAIDTTTGQRAVLGITDCATSSIIGWELPRELLRFDPGAPSFKEPTICLVCEGTILGNYACDTCLGRIALLLKKLKNTSRASANIDSVCLSCGSTVGCNRKECTGFALPVSMIDSEWFGWVTGKEKWALLFKGVQVNQAYTVGMLIRLHPPAGNRCEVCKDSMGANADTLYRTAECCSVDCGKEREPDLKKWAPVLVSLKFTAAGSHDSFCTTCAESFCKDADLLNHKKHTWVSVVPEAGRSCIELPRDHPLTGSLTKIMPLNDEAVDASPAVSSSVLLPLHPRGTGRCSRCRNCLVEGGGRMCSLGCALSVPALQPRAIQLRSRLVAKKF